MRHEVSRLLRVPPPSLRTSIRPRDASDTQQATVVPSGHRPTTDLHARCIWWYVQPRSACTLYWVVRSFCPIPFSHFLRHVNSVNVLQKIKGFRFERSSAPFSILSVILLVLSTLRRLLAHSHLQLQLST